MINKTQNILQQNNGQLNTDVSLQITIPNEFEPMAPINIGYTAGVESSKVSPEWLQKCNTMNKVITTSNHSKFTIESTTYEGKDQFGKDVQLKNETKLQTVSYAVRNVEPDPDWVNKNLPNIPDFNFLAFAQWGPRKNVEATIKNFVEEFKDEDVGLILKLNIAKNNVMDKQATLFRLAEFLRTLGFSKENRKCKIHLIHGHLRESEVRSLFVHPKIKALITTSHGEGFGLSQWEAAQCALPQAMPAWSGYLDFCYCREKDDKSGKMKLRPQFRKIDYDMKTVGPESVWPGVIQPDSQWAFVKDREVKDSMRDLFNNHGFWVKKAKFLQKHVLEEFNADKQHKAFVDAILDCLPKISFENDSFDLNKEIQEKNILNELVES